jgi:hypothetical protein
MVKSKSNYVGSFMRKFIECIFVCLFLYLSLKFIAENPDKVTEFKTWVDSVVQVAATEANKLFKKV